MKILWEDSAVLLDNQDLVIGDLHLGLETALAKKGYRVMRVYRLILSKTIDLIDREDPNRLIILGDLKDSIGNPSNDELFQIEEFIEDIGVPMVVVLGNHDAGLSSFLSSKGVKVYPSSGFMDDGYYLFHGNARPGEGAKKSRMLIACHWHPVIRLVDKITYVEKIWVKVPTTYGPDLLMIPAFNDLVGGASISEISERYLDMNDAEIFLHDGTFLGTWEQLKNKFK